MTDSLIAEIPDFNDPLGVLRACHERMLAQCDMLEKLPAHIAAKGIDDEARSAISRAGKYFSSSAVHHHQDEEEDLFPLLQHQSLKLAESIFRLKQEHQQLTASWDSLAAFFKNPADLKNNPEFVSQLEQFCELYRSHIKFENEDLLAMAQHIISQRQQEELGNAMARRRGLRC
ncbi:Repair of Iron Centers di-iron protein [hydrothermal vent metagenome]|uniref:Repair of Iron Centers di-iron protein n=1 Tax=hydrothermal vent metagenome TaxID=652676 RepID=A0A3B0YV11_9ZZZZ